MACDRMKSNKCGRTLRCCPSHEIYTKGKKWDGAAEVARVLVNVLPERLEFWINLAYAISRRRGGRTSLPEGRMNWPAISRLKVRSGKMSATLTPSE